MSHTCSTNPSHHRLSSYPPTAHLTSTGLPSRTSLCALCFSSPVIFLLVYACVGLNWLLVSFLSHVNKNIIHLFMSHFRWNPHLDTIEQVERRHFRRRLSVDAIGKCHGIYQLVPVVSVFVFNLEMGGISPKMAPAHHWRMQTTSVISCCTSGCCNFPLWPLCNNSLFCTVNRSHFFHADGVYQLYCFTQDTFCLQRTSNPIQSNFICDTTPSNP